MAFYLFINSSNSLTIEPEYDFEEQHKKIEAVHRARAGAEYRYKWGDFNAWKMSVRYVDSSFKATVNTWWNSNADLLFIPNSSTTVYSVHLINKDVPIGKMIAPYTDQFQGALELGEY